MIGGRIPKIFDTISSKSASGLNSKKHIFTRSRATHITAVIIKNSMVRERIFFILSLSFCFFIDFIFLSLFT